MPGEVRKGNMDHNLYDLHGLRDLSWTRHGASKSVLQGKLFLFKLRVLHFILQNLKLINQLGPLLKECKN